MLTGLIELICLMLHLFMYLCRVCVQYYEINSQVQKIQHQLTEHQSKIERILLECEILTATLDQVNFNVDLILFCDT